ncbi:MAG: hypothetical protein LQ341_000862 [Variospora aurantia]|nr:MAG: hypothetical protein LQ341_000862 [Variospora aurantia]
MEDKKGFSLRQKKSSRRPAISAPKQLSNQSTTAHSTFQASHRVNGLEEKPTHANTERPSRPGEKTADLIKRRYSTRFAQLPDFDQADAPPLPNGRLQTENPKLNLPVSGSAHSVNVDVAALKDPKLDPESYATTVLADASDQQLREYQTSLRKLKNRASTDLQQNVFQNRSQFIKISKDAEKLNNEMRTLRSQLAEVSTSVSNLMLRANIPESRPTQDDMATRSRKQANRSSRADLQNMWNVQLHELWKHVEGSQKYLPAIPGRHVISEQSQWVELDAATWRTKKRARIILLNDHLMVAVEHKRRVDPSTLKNGEREKKAGTKLVAEKCWALQDIDILDLASMANTRDKDEMANAINIRCGHESFTYRSDRSSTSDKTKLLSDFRIASEELRRALRANTETSAKGTDTMNYYAARDPTLSQKTDLLRSLSNSKNRPEVLIEVDGNQRNLRWVEGQIDELDIEVALQHFEDAVRHVENLRKLARGLNGNTMAQDLIVTKVDGRANKLAGANTQHLVVQRLKDTHSFPNATQTNVAWLVRLGFDDRARESFLQARSDAITKRARQCIFEGDLRDYIFQVSFVYFTLMKNTVKIFQQCFPTLMMSACVKWAKEHLDGFNVILSRQLSSVQRGSPTWNECMDQAKAHAMMVNEVGLDFKGLVRVPDEDS